MCADARLREAVALPYFCTLYAVRLQRVVIGQ
jgi:hypothetical protein